MSNQSFTTYDQIFDRVKEAIIEAFMLKDPSRITLDSSYRENLDASSLDMVSLLLLLEDVFDENIPESEAREITTVRQTVDLISARLLIPKASNQ